jgi:hypothetical protein
MAKIGIQQGRHAMKSFSAQEAKYVFKLGRGMDI